MKNSMKAIMKVITIIAILATVSFTIFYRNTGKGAFLTLAITAGTIAYHFVMRYMVAGIFRCVMHNQTDLSKKWYKQRNWEKHFYQILRVKQWKSKMPTYEPDSFNLKMHTPDEIAGAMCQAELSHEIIALCSFLPLLAVPAWGAFWVFLITSMLAAWMDLMFAIMQRYNRPRILNLCRKKNRR